MSGIFSVPSSMISLDGVMWVCRVLAGITIIFWPGVLIAGLMSAAGHVTKETAWTGVIRCLYILSIGYPLYMMGLWKLGDSMRTSRPFMALLITAIPVILIYGTWGYISINRYVAKREVTAKNVRLIEEINSALKEKNYGKAFSVFLDDTRSTEAYLLEESETPRFLLTKTVELFGPDPKLVGYLLLYASPDLLGTTSVHINQEMWDDSQAALNLLQRWKNAGITPDELSYGQRWIWNNLELYQMKKSDLHASRILERENALTKRMLNAFEEEEKLLQVIRDFPPELINQEGKIFGTPLNAILLQEILSPSKRNWMKVRVLIKAGAKLAPSEEDQVKRKLLEEIKIL